MTKLGYKLLILIVNDSTAFSLHSEIDPLYDEYKARMDRGEEMVAEAGEYATSFTTQLKYVSKRALLNIIRNPQTSIMQVRFPTFVTPEKLTRLWKI